MIKLLVSALLLTLVVATSAQAETPSTSMDKYGSVYEDIRNGRIEKFEEVEETTYENFDADYAEELLKNFENQPNTQVPEFYQNQTPSTIDDEQESGEE